MQFYISLQPLIDFVDSKTAEINVVALYLIINRKTVRGCLI